MKSILYIVVILIFSNSYSQGFLGLSKKEPLVTVIKTGTYIGLQRGKYNNLELGLIFQKKAIKLIKPVTHALNLGFDYNLTENVLGFSGGYWQKRGRFNLTYGGMFVFKTNFDENKIGLSPVVGYKFSLLHLQLGCNILTHSDTFKNHNTLFVSLRLILVNNRDYKWRDFKKD